MWFFAAYLSLVQIDEVCKTGFQHIGMAMAQVYGAAAIKGKTPSIDDLLVPLRDSRGLTSDEKQRALQDLWMANAAVSAEDRAKLIEFSNRWLMADIQTSLKPEFSKPSILELSKSLSQPDPNLIEVVLITAPWCPHCKDVAPVFESLKDLEVTHAVKIRILSVDSLREEERAALASALTSRGYNGDVDGFPSLLVRKNDKVEVTMSFPRDKENLGGLLKKLASSTK